MTLSAIQRLGVLRGSRTQWRTAKMTRPRRRVIGAPGYSGVLGSTMDALARKGLAEVRWGTPWSYRLTDAGEALRRQLVAGERADVLRAAIARAHELAHERPAGTPDGYVCDAYLLGEISSAVMERALAIRREMHEAAAGTRGAAAR